MPRDPWMPRDLWVLHVPWMTGDPWIPRDPWMYTRPIDAVRFVDPARPVDAAETGGGDAVAHLHPSPTPILQLDGDAPDNEDPGLDLSTEKDLTFDGDRPYLDLDSTQERLTYLKNYKAFKRDFPN